MMEQETFGFYESLNDWRDELDGLPAYDNEVQPEPEIRATFKFRNCIPDLIGRNFTKV